MIAYERAKDTLEQSPDDPAANRDVGCYLCFVKNNWEQGLPHLAKADDSRLREVAEMDLSSPTATADQALLGDAWWDLFVGASSVDKQHFVERAKHWYLKCADELTGLDRTRIENRLRSQ